MPLFAKRRQAIFNNGAKNPNAKEVRVSVIFTRLGEIDTINERFSCEATLFITWRESIDLVKKSQDPNEDDVYYCDMRNLWDPQLYIDNAIGDVKEKDVKYRLEKFYDDEKKESFIEVHMIKKIQGMFFEKLELYHFPFDVQDLSLTLTSHRTLDEIILVQDYNILSKMTKSASLDKHIWKLYDHINFKTHIIRNDLAPTSEFTNDDFECSCSHSAITMQCRVSRKPGYFVINCLLPTLMITLCVFFTFLMDYARFQYRFSLLFTTMLTSITFRWAIHGRVLPTISYMTFLDVYCVSSIMIVFSAMMWHAFYIVVHKRDEDLADKFDAYAMIVFGIVFVLVHIMQTIWFFVAFRKRVQLENLDKIATIMYLKRKMSMYSQNKIVTNSVISLNHTTNSKINNNTITSAINANNLSSADILTAAANLIRENNNKKLNINNVNNNINSNTESSNSTATIINSYPNDNVKLNSKMNDLIVKRKLYSKSKTTDNPREISTSFVGVRKDSASVIKLIEPNNIKNYVDMNDTKIKLSDSSTNSFTRKIFLSTQDSSKDEDTNSNSVGVNMNGFLPIDVSDTNLSSKLSNTNLDENESQFVDKISNDDRKLSSNYQAITKSSPSLAPYFNGGKNSLEVNSNDLNYQYMPLIHQSSRDS